MLRERSGGTLKAIVVLILFRLELQPENVIPRAQHFAAHAARHAGLSFIELHAGAHVAPQASAIDDHGVRLFSHDAHGANTAHATNTTPANAATMMPRGTKIETAPSSSRMPMLQRGGGSATRSLSRRRLKVAAGDDQTLSRDGKRGHPITQSIHEICSLSVCFYNNQHTTYSTPSTHSQNASIAPQEGSRPLVQPMR
jgi:hypothetical protein